MTSELIDRLTAALSDRYAIERELGSGGMATVYLAEDLMLHRNVALKVLKPELASTLGPDRFLQEIDIAAKLNHPHILGLFDCGEADGFLYYVMPYIEGESLREKLAKERELPVSDAVRILKEVALIAAEDTRHTRKLLSAYDIHTPLTSYFDHNENQKSGFLLKKLFNGESVALVSDAGTPGISDP